MLDGIQHDCPQCPESTIDRAVREFNEDGTFHTDTYIALREEGIDPDFYLAQLEGSINLNLNDGGDEE